MNVKVSPTIHRDEKRLKLEFEYNSALIDRVKKIPGRMWSKSMGCWHIPDNEQSKIALKFILKSGDTCEYITGLSNSKKQVQHKFTKSEKVPSEPHAVQIEKFVRWLRGQRYSEKTIETYRDAIQVFLKFYQTKDIGKIDNGDVVRFNYEYILRNKFSLSYQNQVISAIKLFFRIIGQKSIIEEEIERPRSSARLPDILSLSEVEEILKGVVNLKHKALLSTIYACGLRRSEIINLRLNAVDSKRKLLIIKEAKGGKDRIVPLPEALIEMLRQYYLSYKPGYWLFEGGRKGEKYTESSLQQIFKKAIKKAGIKKKVTLHTLRHSYATHLLENGINLRYIQELLGHKSSRTTEIYTHVSAKSIENIKSPFNNLNL